MKTCLILFEMQLTVKFIAFSCPKVCAKTFSSRIDEPLHEIYKPVKNIFLHM
ncbi:unnamed protein product [Tenebrio molitor]|nr:unnamed protein product [Tenebrio molitor]